MDSPSYLLDTDIVIYWLKNKYPVIKRKIETIDDDCIFLSSITAAELYFGAYNSQRRKDNLLLVDRLLQKINIVYFEEKAAASFGEIKAELTGKGKIISDSDLFIASTAISNNFTLVTNN
ncbi:MAG: type II toxin-antitoxin system VapC family toxin [bacterium]|nr:type II toxin-antitoxin system VapC family toxin [bacterium]